MDSTSSRVRGLSPHVGNFFHLYGRPFAEGVWHTCQHTRIEVRQHRGVPVFAITKTGMDQQLGAWSDNQRCDTVRVAGRGPKYGRHPIQGVLSRGWLCAWP